VPESIVDRFESIEVYEQLRSGSGLRSRRKPDGEFGSEMSSV